MFTSTAFRLLAAMLAAGGTVWGLLCLWLILESHSLFGCLLFAPGFAITLGYYIRTVWPPSRALCRALWSFSLLVQAAWLATACISYEGRTPRAVGEWAALGWWGASVVISLFGLPVDPGSLSRGAAEP
jgi:hypothetical protein